MPPFSRSSSARPTHDRVEPRFFRNDSLENPSTPLSAQSVASLLSGPASFAGPHVNETSAMRSSAVFRCVSLKAGVMAALPLKVYKRTKKGREEAFDHRLYPLLTGDPNDLMSGFTWKELIFSNVMLAGNHYSAMEYDGAARVVGLLPVIPQQTKVARVDGRNKYTITLSDGTQETIDQDDMIHVPGIGFDGVKGLSPIQWAGRQPIGISLALEEFTGRIHSNGARPSGVLTLPQGIKADGIKRLRAELDDLYSGNHNAGRILLTDNGSDWKAMQLSLEDAQTLESRRFQIADICRLFGVPPFLVGETDKTSSWGTGIEQMVTGFKVFGIDPELTRVEGELNRKLFKPPYYCEFNRDALTAMDAKTQAELFASAINNAGMTPNEIRRMRNLPDAGPEGDKLYIQGATVPLGESGKVSSVKPTVEPGDPPTPQPPAT